jgi:hypothetical protein
MRRSNLYPAAGSGDPKEFGYKRHNIRHMLGDVTADNLVEFIICKGVRKNPEIVNHICMSFGVCVNANRARRLVPPTTHIKHSLRHIG